LLELQVALEGELDQTIEIGVAEALPPTPGIGGLSLGIANKIMEPWAGAVLAKILVLVFIILFIQKRPRGLFPQKGRAAEG